MACMDRLASGGSATGGIRVWKHTFGSAAAMRLESRADGPIVDLMPARKAGAPR